MNLYTELKRRNVFRVAAAYAVSAWLLIEIGDVLFQAFAFPHWAMQLLITILGLGLIPTLIFSWAYQLTPEGLKRDSEVSHAKAAGHATARRLDQVTIAMILVALGVVFVERFVLPERVIPANKTQAAVDQTGSIAHPPPKTPAKPAPAVGTQAAPDSVAVLPFVNMSPDPDNEYFADGISEEILNVLADVGGLQVASRTSSFSFKGREVPLPKIAAQLGVANVLEGSVRKQGMKVRITAQLIDVATDRHLWSDTYDRNLDDIFKVQEDIAREITDALKVALAGGVTVKAPTENPEAYELYLRGRELFYQRGDSLHSAVEDLKKAVVLDPQFAQAWSVLAATYLVMPSYFDDWKVSASLPLARQAAQRAVSLDPGLGEAQAALAFIARFDGDYLKSEQLFRKAEALSPRDASAWLWHGLLLIELGHLREAEAILRHPVDLEPMVGIYQGWYGYTLFLNGDLAQATKYMTRSQGLGFDAATSWLAEIALLRGDRETAAAGKEAFLRIRRTDPADLELAGRVADAIRDPTKSAQALGAVEAAAARSPDKDWGNFYSALGACREGIIMERRRREQGPTVGTIMWFVWSPRCASALETPEFMQLARVHGLVKFWERGGYPDGCTSAGDHLDCTGRVSQ